MKRVSLLLAALALSGCRLEGMVDLRRGGGSSPPSPEERVSPTPTISSSPSPTPSSSPLPPSRTAHEYFDLLVARPEHWKSYSLRPREGEPITSPYYGKQLETRRNGGYANSNDEPLSVTYSPATDSDPDRQDAAKVVIPAFKEADTLAAPLGASDTSVRLTIASSNTWIHGKGMLIGDEILIVDRPNDEPIVDRLVPVKRGTYGTVAASYPVGAQVSANVNSLGNQVRLPLHTEDGNTYLFTWDGFWTKSYFGTGFPNHKAFQFSSDSSIWLEPQTRFDGGGSRNRCAGFDPEIHVAAVAIRAYQGTGGEADWSLTDGNKLGPGATENEPVSPFSGSFCIRAGTWTRFWVRIEQRANDYDLMDYWVADENNNPVQIYSRIPVSVRIAGGNSIDRFWLEFNTSWARFSRGDRRDFVAYVRNFVALRNPPADVSSLFQRPLR